jgi:hypothetical protein
MIVFWVMICLLSLPILLFYSCDLSPVTKLVEIDVGHNRTISIYGENCWEISRAIYYEVQEGRKIIVPRTLWSFDDPDESYKALEFISAENQSLVGIFNPNRPINEFFIVIDFKTGESWPQFMDGLEISSGKRKNFFKRLQKENPDLKLPTPPPTVSLPTVPTTPANPTPTNTLVIQPTNYYTPEATPDGASS